MTTSTRRVWIGLILSVLFMVFFAAPATANATLDPLEQLGKQLFFDANLSNPPGQSCASCHDPQAGFADPVWSLPVSQGALPDRYGNRNAPSAAYGSLIPERGYSMALGTYVGGLFWDGRADSLEAQAKGPFLNPLEMHMPTKQAVVARVAQAPYRDDFKAYFGPKSLSLRDVDAAYDRIAQAIAAYERSSELNAYSSKHDYAMTLTGQARMMTFTRDEREGMMLFNGEANCSVCHVTPMSGMGGGGMGGGGTGGGGMGGGGMGGGGTGGGGMGGGGMGGGGTGGGGMGGTGGGGMGGGGTGGGMGDVMPEGPIVFSDFRYANLGIPKNWMSPFLSLPEALNPEGGDYIDHGLAADLPGGVEANPQYDGMFRTPSLRNIALTPPYGHNGYFQTLKEIVHFYNTRDVPGAPWPPSEVTANVETELMGNLGLTDHEEDQIVAFLLTLSDGWER